MASKVITIFSQLNLNTLIKKIAIIRRTFSVRRDVYTSGNQTVLMQNIFFINFTASSNLYCRYECELKKIYVS